MANERQKGQVQTKHNAKVDQRRCGDNGWQANARKVRLFDQVAMLQEHAIQAPEHFSKQAPGDDTGTKIDAEGERRLFMAREFGAH